jgi:death-on-curing protein
MNEPLFLTLEQVELLHRESINRFGGTHGVRDSSLFEGAVYHPRNVYYYTPEADLFDIAASYAFHIAQAQALLDGNKRTGMAAALIFLGCNGVEIPESTSLLYDAMIAIAERRMDKKQFAGLLRNISNTKT